MTNPAAKHYSDDQREQFALALLRFDDPFEAALTVSPDPGSAMRLQMDLTNDPDIVNRCNRLLDEYGPEAFLPTKAETMRCAWQMANDRTGHFTGKEKVAALHLYSELNGWVGKTVTPVETPKGGNKPAGGVMLVQDYGPDDNWAKRAAAQQAQLTNAAASAA